MDLVKIGKFLQELRKEKGLTQEQLAEQMGVARRTVSRWETGSNMPDLDVLLELSDLYAVGLREILSGERKSEPMEQELKETVLQVADYSNEGKARLLRKIRGRTLRLLILGLLLAAILIWRFWPHSFMQMIPEAEPESLSQITAAAVILPTEVHDLQVHQYTAVFSKGDEGWSEILWLLSSASYRQDLRNPVLPLLSGYGAQNVDKTVSLFLRWGLEPEEYCRIEFISKNLIFVVSGDESRGRVYHPSDRTLLDKLSEYIRPNDNSSKSMIPN